MKTLVAIAALACTALAAAAEPDPTAALPTPLNDGAFHLTFTLDAWFPRLVGHAPVGAGGANVEVDNLDLHDSEAVFYGAARASWDRFYIELNGYDFNTDGSAPSQPGVASASADWWSSSITFGYFFWTPLDHKSFQWSSGANADYAQNHGEDNVQRLSLAFAQTFSVVWDNIDVDAVASSGSRTTVDGNWAAVRVGAEFVMDLHTKDVLKFVDSVEIYGDISAGPSFGVSGDGDGVGVEWWIDAGMRVFFTPNIAAHVGYRLVDGHYEADSTNAGNSLNVGLQGLVAGVAIRF